ncbi:MAG: alpha/beta hydrolase [Candidatus Moraniibacteriota bacterium]|jgi:carboxylesterase
MTEYIQNLYKTFKISDSDLPQSMIECCEKDNNIINKPFHLKGTEDTCVILVHGWTSTPYEMRVLGEQLNNKGLAVDAPLLSGHGTQPEHLENVSWEQWVSDVEKTYKRVRKQYKKVYLGGMSMGGNLSIQVAANNKDVDGLVLMSTPYKMKHEKAGLCAARTVNKFTKYKKKYYPKFKNKKPSITQLISYQKYPISSAFEALEVIKNSHQNLEKITQPIFIIQPEKDHLISKNSIYNIYNKVNSEKKEMRVIKDASHNFMGNGEHSDVFESVVDFVNKN